MAYFCYHLPLRGMMQKEPLTDFPVIWNSGRFLWGFFLDKWQITENLVPALFSLGPKKESHSTFLRL